MAENKSTGGPLGDGDTGEKKPVSIKTLIIALVVAIVAAIALAFWLTRDSDPGPDETAPPGPGTEQVIPVPTQDPGGSQAPTTAPEDESRRAPTTPRGAPEEDHREGMEGEVGYYEPDDPMSPENGSPQALSKYAVQNMFTAGLTPGMSWDESFHRYDRYYTERLRNEGFKRWWNPDEPEHTLAWEMGVSPDSTARILSYPKMTGEEWLSDDSLRLFYTVNQVFRTDAGTTKLPSFKVMADMVYTDGKWLLDNYYYPRGHEPTIH